MRIFFTYVEYFYSILRGLEGISDIHGLHSTRSEYLRFCIIKFHYEMDAKPSFGVSMYPKYILIPDWLQRKLSVSIEKIVLVQRLIQNRILTYFFTGS